MSDQPPTKKSLGQHWLHDAASLQAMCQVGDVGKQDWVLEIGPGLGTLTQVLCARAGQVIAVEVDRQLAAELPSRVPADNLQVVQQDILSFDLTTLPDYKVVANIPYYLTSQLLRVLSETPNPPQLMALLVQQEVAERLAAQPGSMSLLSVSAQFYWQVSRRETVPAKLFTPPPKVNSQIVALVRRPQPLFLEADPKTFFRLVKAGFAQRRKTLLNSLGSGLHLDCGVVQDWCQQAGIAPGRRAQTLSLEEWHRLYQTWPGQNT